jgi:hypothetical protein
VLGWPRVGVGGPPALSRLVASASPRSAAGGGVAPNGSWLGATPHHRERAGEGNHRGADLSLGPPQLKRAANGAVLHPMLKGAAGPHVACVSVGPREATHPSLGCPHSWSVAAGASAWLLCFLLANAALVGALVTNSRRSLPTAQSACAASPAVLQRRGVLEAKLCSVAEGASAADVATQPRPSPPVRHGRAAPQLASRAPLSRNPRHVVPPNTGALSSFL